MRTQATIIATPIPDTKGSAIAAIPQINITIPQKIIERVPLPPFAFDSSFIRSFSKFNSQQLTLNSLVTSSLLLRLWLASAQLRNRQSSSPADCHPLSKIQIRKYHALVRRQGSAWASRSAGFVVVAAVVVVVVATVAVSSAVGLVVAAEV